MCSGSKKKILDEKGANKVNDKSVKPIILLQEGCEISDSDVDALRKAGYIVIRVDDASLVRVVNPMSFDLAGLAAIETNHKCGGDHAKYFGKAVARKLYAHIPKEQAK